jgi:hypothetical protein
VNPLKFEIDLVLEIKYIQTFNRTLLSGFLPSFVLLRKKIRGFFRSITEED